MAWKVEKVDVWVAEIQDRIGGLAQALGPFGAAGVSLECVLARRQPEKPKTGLVFVAPVLGARAEEAAKRGGFEPSATVPSLRIEGPDRAGAGHAIAEAIAETGVSVRGLSSMALGGKFVCYVGFHSPEDLRKSEKAIRAIA